MKSLIKSLSLWMLMGSLFVGTSSCEKDQTQTNGNNNVETSDKTLKDELEATDEYSMMNQAIEESDNSALFADANASITLFVADNDAWNQFMAEMNVNSITELKSKMGEEKFSRFVLYQALHGKFNTSSLNEGYYESEAKNEHSARLDLHVRSGGSESLVINNEEDGTVTNGKELNVRNGTMIGVDAVVHFQNGYEVVEEMDEENQDDVFFDLLVNSSSHVKGELQNENEDYSIFYTGDANADVLLDLNLRNVLDESDLDELLDPSEKNSLFARLNVNTYIELLNKLTLQVLLDAGVDLQQVWNVMDDDDYMELISSVMIDASLDADAMINEGSITTESGMTFAVTTTSKGNLRLTDSDNNTIVLSRDHVTSVNGSVYTVLEITKG